MLINQHYNHDIGSGTYLKIVIQTISWDLEFFFIFFFINKIRHKWFQDEQQNLKVHWIKMIR